MTQEGAGRNTWPVRRKPNKRGAGERDPQHPSKAGEQRPCTLRGPDQEDNEAQVSWETQTKHIRAIRQMRRRRIHKTPETVKFSTRHKKCAGADNSNKEFQPSEVSSQLPGLLFIYFVCYSCCKRVRNPTNKTGIRHKEGGSTGNMNYHTYDHKGDTSSFTPNNGSGLRRDAG